MLVCSVVMRPRRVVAATLAEAGAALDHVNTLGLGQLVEEAASAAASTDAIASYRIAIVEPASASDSFSATVTSSGVLSGTVSESASAADAPDAVRVSVGGRQAMLPSVFVNAGGTARQANADGIMVNL